MLLKTNQTNYFFGDKVSCFCHFTQKINDIVIDLTKNAFHDSYAHGHISVLMGSNLRLGFHNLTK